MGKTKASKKGGVQPKSVVPTAKYVECSFEPNRDELKATNKKKSTTVDAAGVAKELLGLALAPHGVEPLYWTEKEGKERVNKNIINWTNKIMKDPRLIRIKGTEKKMTMKEVWRRRDQMNSGDVFILDTGNLLYIWQGKHSNKYERQSAFNVVKQIIKSRGMNTHHVILTEGENDDCEAFWKEIRQRPLICGFESLIGPKYHVQEAKKGSDKDVTPFKKKLYPVKLKGKSRDSIVVQRRWRAKQGGNLDNQFAKRKLESHKVYLLDDGFTLWVWLGQHSNISEDAAYQQAVAYLKEKNNHTWLKQSHDRPASLPILVVKEDSEPKEFLDNFQHVRNKRRFRGLNT